MLLVLKNVAPCKRYQTVAYDIEDLLFNLKRYAPHLCVGVGHRVGETWFRPVCVVRSVGISIWIVGSSKK